MPRKLARSLETTFSFHAPMAGTNIGTLSRELAGPILERLQDLLDNASVARADSWVLHPGFHSRLSWAYPGLDCKSNKDRIGA